MNADEIAARQWPGEELQHGHDAAKAAAAERANRLEARTSFITETVFSHESKVHLVKEAQTAGYLVTLHVLLIPEDLAVTRVANRVAVGGHDVRPDKIRERYGRLWVHIADAIAVVRDAIVYDNTNARTAFRVVATYHGGRPTNAPTWPVWTPEGLRHV